METTALDQVIVALRAVTDLAELEASRVGYFSALYTRVTVAVTQAIRDGFFTDGPQMARLDVAFVELYLDALGRHRRGESGVAEAWHTAFVTAARTDTTVLQHLYLGMNAHLLVDLPLAVARTCPRERLPTLRRDFLRINEIVAGEMTDFHADLCVVSPELARLHARAGRLWSASSNAMLRISRRLSWAGAAWLAAHDEAEQRALIRRFDGIAARSAAYLSRRGGALELAFGAPPREGEDVRKVIRVLRGTKKR